MHRPRDINKRLDNCPHLFLSLANENSKVLVTFQHSDVDWYVRTLELPIMPSVINDTCWRHSKDLDQSCTVWYPYWSVHADTAVHVPVNGRMHSQNLFCPLGRTLKGSNGHHGNLICDHPPRNWCKVAPGSFSVYVISRRYMS